jgi:hypothetical protein
MKLIIDDHRNVCANNEKRTDIFENPTPKMLQRSISTDSDMDMDAALQGYYNMNNDTSVDGYTFSTTLASTDTGFDSTRSGENIEDRMSQHLKNIYVLKE